MTYEYRRCKFDKKAGKQKQENETLSERNKCVKRLRLARITKKSTIMEKHWNDCNVINYVTEEGGIRNASTLMD